MDKEHNQPLSKLDQIYSECSQGRLECLGTLLWPAVRSINFWRRHRPEEERQIFMDLMNFLYERNVISKEFNSCHFSYKFTDEIHEYFVNIEYDWGRWEVEYNKKEKNPPIKFEFFEIPMSDIIRQENLNKWLQYFIFNTPLRGNKDLDTCLDVVEEFVCSLSDEKIRILKESKIRDEKRELKW